MKKKKKKTIGKEKKRDAQSCPGGKGSGINLKNKKGGTKPDAKNRCCVYARGKRSAKYDGGGLVEKKGGAFGNLSLIRSHQTEMRTWTCGGGRREGNDAC